MEHTTITVRTNPDALVKIYDETHDEILYLNNTDDNGETTPINLPNSGHYYLDITVFDTPIQK
jgi:hypothetical protein